MSNVIDLRPSTQTGIWRCDCGCMTFYLRGDGEAVCAHCDGMVVGTSGNWSKLPPPEKPPDEPGHADRVVDLGDPTAAARRFLRRAIDSDLTMLVAIRAEGGVSVWGGVETKEQRSWLIRRLRDAYRLACGGEHGPH